MLALQQQDALLLRQVLNEPELHALLQLLVAAAADDEESIWSDEELKVVLPSTLQQGAVPRHPHPTYKQKLWSVVGQEGRDKAFWG